VKLVKGTTTRRQVEQRAVRKYGEGGCDIGTVEVLCKCPGAAECRCKAEADGACAHGCRSIILVAGLI
jgi:hypothetical protein